MNEQIRARLDEAAVPYIMHTHPPFRTVADMVAHWDIRPEQTLKTVALWIKNGDYLLIALRGSDRVDYKRIAKRFGVSRRNVRPMAADDVLAVHGYVVGGVSPFVWRDDAHLLIDDAIAQDETIYTGGGTVTTTLQMKMGDLLLTSAGEVGAWRQTS